MLKRIGSSAYKLELPPGLTRLHDVFHTSLISLDPNDPLPGQIQEPPGPIQIDNEEEWEVEQILDSRFYYGRVQYRVKWRGHNTPDLIWHAADNFENAPDSVKAYHEKYPAKPGPHNLQSTREQREARRAARANGVQRRIDRARINTLRLQKV